MKIEISGDSVQVLSITTRENVKYEGGGVEVPDELVKRFEEAWEAYRDAEDALEDAYNKARKEAGK